MILFLVFLLGLTIGSFLNAFIYRLEVQHGLRVIPRDREKANVTVMQGRSFCPQCGHTLAWQDLIPLLSFLLLLGKCRYCQRSISWQYPLVEIATALLFVLLFFFTMPWLGQGVENLTRLSFTQLVELLYLWAVASALLVIFVYDLKYYLIPDKVLYLAITAVLFWRGFEFLDFGSWDLFGIWNLEFGIFAPLVQAILAGLGASLFFLLIYIISNGRAMGFGDVKLAFLLGLFLGWPAILVALFSAFCLGAIVGVALIALKKKGLKSEVPFAPFLIVGTAIAYFFGSSIVNFYMNLIL
jgi:leader peptidase (prepilin peptidase) / N-methyltransferase